jgi:hypothetical protein
MERNRYLSTTGETADRSKDATQIDRTRQVTRNQAGISKGSEIERRVYSARKVAAFQGSRSLYETHFFADS